MEQVTLTVTGMTCGGCESAVQRAVGRLAGVSTVTASHAANRVVVEYDPERTDAAAIARAIQDAGYVVASR